MPHNDFVKIKYYDGSINKVDTDTKMTVKNTLQKAVKKIDNKFFKGVSIHVASDFSNLDNHNSLAKLLKRKESDYSSINGITDCSQNREIYIQESSFKICKLVNVFTSLSFGANKEIAHTTMHEIGHQFNYFYGTDNVMKKKYDALMTKYPNAYDGEVNTTKEETNFFKTFMNNNGYSDKKDFKDAVLKDFQSINPKKHIHEGYIIGEFYNRGLEVKPTYKDVQSADYSRGEVFAQLFAYAMGTDDGKKEEYIKMFPNTYKVVQKYISMHSK